jgi:beta-ureidopropionase / N-carbamoyl-L-amino-acid hydrolase
MSVATRGDQALGIDVDRLWSDLAASSRIGAIPGDGLRRLPLTDADREMRELFVSWCEDAGLDVRVDRIGNVFARREGSEDLPAVLLGSHLDSQVNGGRFDGVLGVLAALEIVRSLGERGVQTRRPIEIVSWTDEEGARFRTGMLGASAFTGRLPLAEALAKEDEAGATVGDELARIGFDGPAAAPGPPPYAYLELHIEQDDRLETAGVDVGVVDASYGVYYLDVRFRGETSHGGPTPMCLRRNALVGAAAAIVAVDRIAREHGPDAKSNASTISVWPNLSGNVPGEATVRFDFRHPERGTLERMRSEIEAALWESARAARVESEIASRVLYGAIEFDRGCVEAIERAAEARGERTLRLKTQAAHDAMVLADFCPAAMVFCPCRGGITHNPAEYVDRERARASIEVLLDAVLELADASAASP